jgi:hypothetical protein
MWEMGLFMPDYLHTRGTDGGLIMSDEFVQEIRRIRNAQAARHGYDIDKIIDAAKARQLALGVQVVSFAKSGHSMNNEHNSGPCKKTTPSL